MPHVPSSPPGTRFFARIDRFHCECPACGQLIVAHKDYAKRITDSAFKRRRATVYNPIASQLTCPGCHRIFGVGLVLWPLRRGGRRKDIPADHQPTLREIRALAGQAYGIWTTEAKRQGDAINLAIDAECICPPGGWRGDCLVHPRLFGGPDEDDPDETA
jgi:rubredoxin